MRRFGGGALARDSLSSQNRTGEGACATQNQIYKTAQAGRLCHPNQIYKTAHLCHPKPNLQDRTGGGACATQTKSTKPHTCATQNQIYKPHKRGACATYPSCCTNPA